MIPPLFVFLDTLPLTPNGKIDRNALPPPDGERPQLDQGFVEPRTEIEELIAQVWREILKLDKIGVHDNFFELGGHSLLATRVVARLRRNFHVDIALRKLFELPTVAGLGTAYRSLAPQRIRHNIARSCQPIELNCSHYHFPNAGSGTCRKSIRICLHTIFPAAFRIKGDLDSTALEQALNEMVARHDVLRSYKGSRRTAAPGNLAGLADCAASDRPYALA